MAHPTVYIQSKMELIAMSRTFASLACCLTSLFFAGVSTAQDESPDEKATKLIDRIQSLKVAPAPADAKQFKIYGTVLNPEYKPARGIVKSVGQPIAGCRVEFAKSSTPGKRRAPAGLVENDSIVDAVLTDKDGIAIVRPASGWGEYVPDGKRNFRQDVIDKFIANVVSASIELTGGMAQLRDGAEVRKSQRLLMTLSRLSLSKTSE